MGASPPVTPALPRIIPAAVVHASLPPGKASGKDVPQACTVGLPPTSPFNLQTGGRYLMKPGCGPLCDL